VGRIVRDPKNPILDAELAAEEAKRVFGFWLDAARDLRDYLALAAQRFHGVGSAEVIDFVLLASQYRNALVAYDGLVVQLEAGASEAALVLCRTLFEARLYIGWILHPADEAERAYRANVFHVAAFREDRYWTNLEIPGTPEFIEYRAAWDARLPAPKPETIAKMQAHLLELDRLFAMPHNAEINDAFDKCVNPRNRRDPEWFRVGRGSCASLADMANRLGLKARYLSIYRFTSHYAHGSFAYQGVEIRDKATVIHPVRQIERLWTPFAIGVQCADEILELLMARYRPTELQNLLGVRPRWWKALTRQPKINVDETLVPTHGPPC
jgi:hypothetical protein